MKRYLFWKDPLCITSSILYCANRFLVKPHWTKGFFSSHFNDLLLIPAALPVLLHLHGLMGLRNPEKLPTSSEISLHLLAWSVICEWIGPVFLNLGVADPFDVLAYATGALAAGWWWRAKTLQAEKS